MEFEFLIGASPHKVTVEMKGEQLLLREGTVSFEANLSPISPGAVSLIRDGKSITAYYARQGERVLVFLGGRQYVLEAPGEERGHARHDDAGPEDKLRIKAPMPGKVIQISVAEGDEVRKNQTLAIVEAMKMENEIKSAIEAVVKKIHVAAGDLVDAERPLMELTPKG